MTLLRARAIENQAFVVGVNRVGDDGNGIAHVGDSVVLDFTGQPLVELNDRPQAVTIPLDLEALRGWRDKFPAHLDADAFTSRIVKKPTLVNHPPDVAPPPGNQPVIAPIYQSVKYEFETIDDTLRMLRGETPGYFYMRASNPTTRQLELTLAAAAGPRRLPRHGVRRQRHRADADCR